jgi:hypothetical protein
VPNFRRRDTPASSRSGMLDFPCGLSQAFTNTALAAFCLLEKFNSALDDSLLSTLARLAVK